MNATARMINEAQLDLSFSINRFITIQNLFVVLLLLAVFCTSLGVVYIKEHDRQLFYQLETQQQLQDKLHVEWGQLLLEQSTWATQARVQRIAQHTLHMELPPQANIIMVRS